MAGKKKAAKKKSAPKATPEVPKGARQKPLPGMENRAIEALDDAALRYDEIKKARMKLTVQEVEAKREVAVLMRTRKKKHYQHGNIVIDIVPEGEKVKVKVSALGDEEEPPEIEDAEPPETGAEPEEEFEAEEAAEESDYDAELEAEEIGEVAEG